ncbi:MAG: polysaccharide lyase family 1 protein [Mangrovibacterium sp.]
MRFKQIALISALFFSFVACAKDAVTNDDNNNGGDNTELSETTILFDAGDTISVDWTASEKPHVTGTIENEDGLLSYSAVLMNENGDKKVLFTNKAIEGTNYNFNMEVDYAYNSNRLLVSVRDANNKLTQDTLYIHVYTPGSGLNIAFPGAEGYGRNTTGGRGGKVIYVTNLNDTGAGSLRAAINTKEPRIVLFKVSGTIALNSELSISNGNITIAGQTAPGDGITLRNYPVTVKSDNVIIRYVRFRMGDKAKAEGDALGGRFHKNIMIDHCSISWSTDEACSFYANENTTVQWTIISESLANSVHAKGAHGYGGVWGGKNASFHHNLMASHSSRTPRFGETPDNDFALTDLVDVRNNVYYNYAGEGCYGGEGMNINIVNNYYKPGPATPDNGKAYRIAQLGPYISNTSSPIFGVWGTFYVNGNYVYGHSETTNDNWNYGIYNQFWHTFNEGGEFAYMNTEESRNAMHLRAPLKSGTVTTHTAEKAYELVLNYAGASLSRDEVDERAVNDTRAGSASIMDGGNGSTNGLIDTQDAVGGWPELVSTDAPKDTDSDGMPDEWETTNSLNPNDASDAQKTAVDGEYPNIEAYINGLVSNITNSQNGEK